MFKKVLWATDGSEAADQAMPVAENLAAEGGGELVVVHCQELMTPVKGGGRYPLAANEDELRAKIQRQVAELSGNSVRVSSETGTAVVGGAAHMIADAARDEQADVIVVGTRGHTPLGGLLVGSVTQRLLHIAPCPVLVVPSRNGGTAD
jgi:nucleotide-binding universal stress UspA family protein